jgi:hypothetical protein
MSMELVSGSTDTLDLVPPYSVLTRERLMKSHDGRFVPLGVSCPVLSWPVLSCFVLSLVMT